MFLQFLSNGVLIGCSYTLVALGLTLIFSILNVVNFAHGEIYMLGAYATFYIVTLLGINYYVALIIAVIVVGLIGVLIEKMAFRPLYGKPEINMFLVSIGLTLFLRNLMMVIAGTEPKQLETPLSGGTINLAGVYITYERLLVIVLSLIVIAALHLFIYKTKLGKAIRAVSQNSYASGVVGINRNMISSLTFGLGCLLAAASGALLGPLYLVSPEMGEVPVVKAFTIIILGGLGNIVGCIVGGFILGISESLAGGYFLYEYKDAICFAILILVLSLKPSGLLGRG
jgi:branched-chain amino acid transport system permease protein